MFTPISAHPSQVVTDRFDNGDQRAKMDSRMSKAMLTVSLITDGYLRYTAPTGYAFDKIHGRRDRRAIERAQAVASTLGTAPSDLTHRKRILAETVASGRERSTRRISAIRQTQHN